MDCQPFFLQTQEGGRMSYDGLRLVWFMCTRYRFIWYFQEVFISSTDVPIQSDPILYLEKVFFSQIFYQIIRDLTTLKRSSWSIQIG